MCNCDISRVAAGNGDRLWQIADALGISDAQFSRKLRREISTEEKEKVFEIIAQLAAEV